jgi:hypothetical protein
MSAEDIDRRTGGFHRSAPLGCERVAGIDATTGEDKAESGVAWAQQHVWLATVVVKDRCFLVWKQVGPRRNEAIQT